MNGTKILIVESDSSLVENWQRDLQSPLQLEFSLSGTHALSLLQERGPYAVVLSAMNLPEMTGAHLLSEACRVSPDTVRVLLAGSADLTAALEAVNEGHIYRLIATPCTIDALSVALAAGVQQYHLVQRERELLEKTLTGSIRTLNDVLSAACPEAFGRSMRVSRAVDFMTSRFKVAAPWRFHVAATLSQLGCVTLDSELVGKGYAGSALTPEEQERFQSHPNRAMEILGCIPALEPVAWMIGQQFQPEIPPFATENTAVPAEEILLGAKMLKLAVTYEELRTKLASEEFVMIRLRNRVAEFSPELIEALAAMSPGQPMKDLRRIATAQLKPGMVLNQEIRNRQGLLVVARGQRLTVSMLFKLENFARTGTIDREVMAFVEI